MKKIVISESGKLQEKVNYWILDYPKLIEPSSYEKELPKVYKDFYNALENTA